MRIEDAPSRPGWVTGVTWAVVIVVLLASALVFGGVTDKVFGAATAAEPEPPVPETQAAIVASKSSVARIKPRADRICRKARRIDHRPGKCRAVGKRWKGKPKLVHSRQIARLGIGNLRSVDGSTTLAEAALIPPPLYSVKWEETLRGAFYINWKEVHSGKFYYNGSDVWIDTSMGAYHRCDQGSGIGYAVDVTTCDENILYVDTVPGYGYQNWDYFKVHVAYKGFPLAASHNMHANVYPSGNVYGY